MRNSICLLLLALFTFKAAAASRRTVLQGTFASYVRSWLPPFLQSLSTPQVISPAAPLPELAIIFDNLLTMVPIELTDPNTLQIAEEQWRAGWQALRQGEKVASLFDGAIVRYGEALARANAAPEGRMIYRRKIVAALKDAEFNLARDFGLPTEVVRRMAFVLQSRKSLICRAFETDFVSVQQLPFSDEFIDAYLNELSLINPELAVWTVEHLSSKLSEADVKPLGIKTLNLFSRWYLHLRESHDLGASVPDLLRFEFEHSPLPGTAAEISEPVNFELDYTRNYKHAVERLDHALTNLGRLPEFALKRHALEALTQLRSELQIEMVLFEMRFENVRSLLLRAPLPQLPGDEFSADELNEAVGEPSYGVRPTLLRLSCAEDLRQDNGATAAESPAPEIAAPKNPRE